MRNLWTKLALAALLTWTLTSHAPAAARQEVWLINTHCVGDNCCPAIDASPVACWRLESDCQWIVADLAALLAGDDPGTPTIVFIHGNRSDPNDAVRMAWQLYAQLLCDAGTRPFRLVIWTWPAERMVRGVRADVQLKACRSDTESFLLAQYLDRTQPAVTLNLVGYSFGARVISGALELLAGGSINGCCLSRTNTLPRVPIRAMLMAAAMDADWLLPGHRNGNALSQVEQVYITVNTVDPVLKRYPLMYHIHGPQSLGYVGPLGWCLGAEQAKLELAGVACSVGRHHDWDHYISGSGVLWRLAGYTFREPAAMQTPTPAAAAATETSMPTEQEVAASR